MEPACNWRKGPGRRQVDRIREAYDPLAVRGLLHDLAHQVTTLSCLVEAVRGEGDLPQGARHRMEILALELTRLLDIIRDELSGAAAAEVSTIDVRSLAHRVEQLTRIRHPASVMLLPGPEVTAEADPSLLWRVFANVVENAARATGPQGKVEIRLRHGREPAIDVIDDGPGLGLGPPGTSSLGLLVVTSLLESCGGALEVWSPLAGGTRVSIRLPAAHGDGRAKPEGDAS